MVDCTYPGYGVRVTHMLIDLRLSCVCVMIDTINTCNIYVVVSLGWQTVY